MGDKMPELVNLIPAPPTHTLLSIKMKSFAGVPYRPSFFLDGRPRSLTDRQRRPMLRQRLLGSS